MKNTNDKVNLFVQIPSELKQRIEQETKMAKYRSMTHCVEDLLVKGLELSDTRKQELLKKSAK